MKNCISITLKKDYVQMVIGEDADQTEIEECLNKKLPKLKKLYKQEKVPIYVKGKDLKSKEIDRIQNIIKDVIDVKIEFESSKILGLHGIKKVFKKEIATSETKFHRGAVRSGQKIEFEGSLVILGDVNGGAEVVAGENIVVLGILRGLAHAGAKGNKQAIISAALIDSPQVRIANIVKEMQKEELENLKSRNYASINEKEEVVIE
ncbi:MAG: septum site-determining protein MinC [Clostridia bacterium]|nr:septum site-determining protein MinC [Clostridia bacterium]